MSDAASCWAVRDATGKMFPEREHVNIELEGEAHANESVMIRQ